MLYAITRKGYYNKFIFEGANTQNLFKTNQFTCRYNSKILSSLKTYYHLHVMYWYIPVHVKTACY